MPREEEVIPEEEIIGELIKALANEKAQDDIIYALAQIGNPVLPYIRKLLQEKSVDSRITGVKILGGMGKPALQDLMAATNDKNSTVRYKAVRYIGHLEDQAFEALNILTKLSKDKDQWVQEKAQWAVKRIKKSYVDRQITEILSVAYTKYKANDITFAEFTKIIGNYGKRSKYILDKIVNMKDVEQTKLYLKVYDYLVKEKMFSINDDVFNVIQRDKIKLNFNKRFSKKRGYYGLHPTRNYMNFIKSDFFQNCKELIKKGNIQDVIAFYKQNAEKEPYMNTIVFVRIFAFLDRNHKYKKLLSFFDEHYFLYDSENRTDHLASIEKYILLQKTIFHSE